MHPGQFSWGHPSAGRRNEYPEKAGRVNRYRIPRVGTPAIKNIKAGLSATPAVRIIATLKSGQQHIGSS